MAIAGVEVVRVEIAKLELKPTDILVLRIPGPVPSDWWWAYRELAAQLRVELGVKALVVNRDCELQAIEVTEGEVT